MISLSKERTEKIASVVNNRQEGIIVLEDVHDPHNAEAVVRTSDAFGFQKICLVFEKEKAYDPKLVGKSSSRGTNKWMDFTIFKSSLECVEYLKKNGYLIVVTTLDGNSNSIYREDLSTKKIAVVFGNEHSGVSELMKKMADRLVNIPMLGMAQSLNVSVSAAIFMYEISRQRRLRDKGKFRLTEKEKINLKERFILKR